MLRWDRKGSRRASRAPRPTSATTMPRTARWYVPLVASLPRITSVTASRSVGDAPASECTDAVTGPSETRSHDEPTMTRRRRRGPADRALPRLPRRGGRRRQDLRHARRGLAPLPARGRRRGRLRRDAQAALHDGADPRPSRGARASRSSTGTRPGRRWTSTPSWRASPRSCSSTSWPTPTCRDPAATRSAGRTCSRSSTRASRSSPRSTSSTSSPWPTPSSGSPASACASGCPTGWCAGPTSSS